MNFVNGSAVFDSFVVRYAKAYPVYKAGYADALRTLRKFLGAIENLYPIGRYGQFRYNNMDHSILTAQLSVQKMNGAATDPWSVNVEEAGYLEEKKTS
jgi:protoporphyrinogen oxidase